MGVGVVLLSALGFGGVVRAAPSPQSEQQPFLLALRGQSVVLNYTPGALDRAVHVQRRLELLSTDFSRWSNVQVRLRVFVLSRDEWGHFGFHLPYGLPGRVSGTTLAVPSYGDAGTVELWTQIRGFPPPPLAGIPMKGTAEEAASLALSDLLMEVEAARVLLSLGGLQGEVSWLHQLMAHSLARSAFEAYESGRLAEIDAFFDSLGSGIETPLPLNRYAAGLELETLLWFESRFQDGARVLLASGKKNEAKGLLKQAAKSGGELTESLFFELFPEMRGWLETTFAADVTPTN